MNLEGLASPFTWEYDETNGFLNRLTYPNGMVRNNTYHPKLNLLTSIGYEKGENGETVAGHEYQYDALTRPTQRRDSWDTTTPETVRDFTYNSRSELIEDQTRKEGSYSYRYDNIGNRKIGHELEEEVSYDANSLNQYTGITKSTLHSPLSTLEQPFVPQYDADGNQTSIRTSTGIWEVSYDANDRPVIFTSQNGRTVIECGYDYQGRRFEKKVIVNGSTVSYAWYLYRGYLQLAELDLIYPEPMLVKSYWWDPTETIATRILMMSCWKDDGEKVEEHFYFMHDALKNVTSIFDEQQTRRARYVYAPFGSLITAEGDMAWESRFRFSCEFSDDELGLIYYNYRHLNPHDGRWINRDPIQEQGGTNLYGFVGNYTFQIDSLGLIVWQRFIRKRIIGKIKKSLIPDLNGPYIRGYWELYSVNSGQKSYCIKCKDKKTEIKITNIQDLQGHLGKIEYPIRLDRADFLCTWKEVGPHNSDEVAQYTGRTQQRLYECVKSNPCLSRLPEDWFDLENEIKKDPRIE